ncbi:hypothetical protein BH09PAT2_BH09PAT2_08470 [soil metagenome]
MTPIRNVSSLILLALVLFTIHNILTVAGKNSLSSQVEVQNNGKNVLGVFSSPNVHIVTIFYHRFFVPN